MKRFYDKVEVSGAADGFQVTLDERGLKTVKGTPQIVPSRSLADALALEWAKQGEDIDTSRFVLRDFADYALDIVRADRAAAIEKILGYGETDTLCYRADPEDALYQRQQQLWDPVLTEIEARVGIRIRRVSGIVHRPQPDDTLDALRQRLEGLDDFTLSGLEALTSLAASLCIGLAALEPDADHAALWNAASLEETWQADLWGKDSEAETRRGLRRADFLKAAEFVQLVRAD